jgi:multidrug transporter EmrE-like cation transporter
MAYVFLFISIAANSLGQILMKYAADRLTIDKLFAWASLREILLNPYVIGGITTYVIGMFAWLFTLSKLELSVAYPFLALTYVVVFVAAVVLFKETVLATKILGVVLIMAGIILVSGGSK